MTRPSHSIWNCKCLEATPNDPVWCGCAVLLLPFTLGAGCAGIPAGCQIRRGGARDGHSPARPRCGSRLPHGGCGSYPADALSGAARSGCCPMAAHASHLTSGYLPHIPAQTLSSGKWYGSLQVSIPCMPCERLCPRVIATHARFEITLVLRDICA